MYRLSTSTCIVADGEVMSVLIIEVIKIDHMEAYIKIFQKFGQINKSCV